MGFHGHTGISASGNTAGGWLIQGKNMSDYSDTDKHEDMKVLHSMGYAQ